MAQIQISCSALSPTIVDIICSSVSYSLRKNNSVKPLENGTNMAEVNTRSFDNPTIVLNGVLITNASNTFTLSHALTLLALRDSASVPILLDIDYGREGMAQGLPKWTPSGINTNAIPVIFDSASFSISAEDSKDAYLPTGTITFTQTRE